jgi:hypothetical protein
MRTFFLPPAYQDSAESGRLILRDGSTAFEERGAGLLSTEETRAVLQAMCLPVAPMEGLLAQPTVGGVVEVMVSMREGSLFGPLIACALGGIHMELIADMGV